MSTARSLLALAAFPLLACSSAPVFFATRDYEKNEACLNVEQALRETKEGKARKAELLAEFEKMKTELTAKVEALKARGRDQVYRHEVVAVQEELRLAQDTIFDRERQLVRPIVTGLHREVEVLAAARKLSRVYESCDSGLPDLTAEVVAAYDRRTAP
jgi:hypothetical protein